MSGSSSAYSGLSDSISQFRVEKSRTPATLTLSSGASVRGCFFVSRSSRTHEGPERIKDVLNGETGFVPFEVVDAAGSRTILYSREHLVFVTLADIDEALGEPGYDVATVRHVSLLLSNGMRLRGTVRVERPQGYDRLSDFARTGDTFRYLEAEQATYLINIHHVLELAEETSGS